MATYKKVFITVTMILVWGWTVFMGTWSTSLRGRIALISTGILLNSGLAIWYSYLEKRSRRLNEEAKTLEEEV